MSWKTMMEFKGEKPAGNQLRFATKEEAARYGHDLLMRWYVPVGYQTVECDDPVNSRWNFDKDCLEHLRDPQ